MSNGQYDAQNNHTNDREKTTTASNGWLFGNGTNGTGATNNIFGGQQRASTSSQPNSSNDHGNSPNGNKMNVINKQVNNDINGPFNAKNPSNDHHAISPKNHTDNFNQSVFSRLNFNAVNTGRNNAIGVQYDAGFTNGQTMNGDDNVNDGNDEPNTMANNARKQFNGNLKTTSTTTRRTNDVNLFEAIPFSMNNGGGGSGDVPAANQGFVHFNQQPNSGNFLFHLLTLIPPKMTTVF